MNVNVRNGSRKGKAMNFKQAQKHNTDIAEKIKVLQGEYVSRMHTRVVERLPDGKREVVVDNTEDYMKAADTKALYNDYRALYPEDKKFFILIEPIDDIKRTVRVQLPTRSDSERQPPSHLSDPTPAELGEK